MDYVFERKWQETVKEVSDQYGEELDLQALLFLIGVQELGLGYKKFKKDEKIDLMHIAICTLLEPYGYFEYEGRDEDGWPHFTRNQKLPALDGSQQERLIKEAVIEYFSGEEA
ncbi:hypothetical protein [Halocola ammonii]